MSIKLKALALGLLAALAVGGVSVVSAGADSGGVMHSDVEWTHIAGSQEGSLHDNVLYDHDKQDGITCTTVNYTANVAGKTATQLTVTATYAGCKTTVGGVPAVINMNGCAYVLTFTDIPTAKHHTFHIECPAGKEIKMSVNPPIVGECHTYIPPQTPTAGGVAYKTETIGGKHALTLEITVEGLTNFKEETGFGCGGAGGHSNSKTLKATVVAQGRDTSGGLVNLTVTTASS